MDPENQTDPLARERARKRRAKQIQRRRLVALGGLIVLLIVIVALIVGLSGGDETGTSSTSSTTETTEPGGTTDTTTDGETTSTSDGETTSTGEVNSTTFTAELTGDQAVPAVDTTATATLDLEYDADDETFTFVLRVVNTLTNPTVASIFEGASRRGGRGYRDALPRAQEDGRLQWSAGGGLPRQGRSHRLAAGQEPRRTWRRSSPRATPT